MKRYTITITGITLVVSSVDAESEEGAIADMDELGYWHYCHDFSWNDIEYEVTEETEEQEQS